MRELSLFSGAGGGLLGSLLLGWEPIGYVEFNDYCQRVIAQRIADGILPNAPIFGDIRTFVSEGYAASYTGLVDVITGGFPCQPFSVAGRKLAADDPRNMWPATFECIRIIRPRFAFLENVPGLIATGYFNTVIGDLAQSGYDCRWRVLSAAELGAPHRRERLWIVATDTHGAKHEARKCAATPLEDAFRDDTGGLRDVLADANSRCSQRTSHEVRAGRNVAELGGEVVANTPGARPQGRKRPTEAKGGRSQRGLTRPSWWEVEPDVGRVVDGMASRVDRLKAIGNGQVPSVAATAWHLLTEGL